MRPKKTWMTLENALVLGFFGVGFVMILLQLSGEDSILNPLHSLHPLTAYHSAQYGFSITYPQSWIVRELEYGRDKDPYLIGYITPTTLLPGLSIAKKEQENITLDDATDWVISRISCSTDDKKILGYTNSQVEGNKLEYSCPWSSGMFRKRYFTKVCHDYYFVHNRSVYALSFCAEQDQWPIIEPVFAQMIDSFRFGE